MKIKISDLVNKVINREEMPKEVLFDGNIYNKKSKSNGR